MPLYTYECPTHGLFCISSSIAEYKPKTKCPTKKCRKVCERNIMVDASTLVGVADATPKTVGGLADKNADKMSDDQKAALYKKHNAYKEADPNVEPRPLPPGMERIERPKEREYWR